MHFASNYCLARRVIVHLYDYGTSLNHWSRKTIPLQSKSSNFRESFSQEINAVSPFADGFNSSKNANLVKDVEFLLPIKFCQSSFISVVAKEKSKISQSIRDKDSHLCWRNGPKNTNLAEDSEYLPSTKFHPFSGCMVVEFSKWRPSLLAER